MTHWQFRQFEAPWPRSPRIDTSFPARHALLVACTLLATRCGGGTRAEPDAGASSDSALDATPDAAGAFDGGEPYDCDSACSSEPPICVSPDPDHRSCLDLCRAFAHATGCEFDEGLRLLECLAVTPGACEELPLGDCYPEYQCFHYCTDPSSEFWCRPPA